MGHPIWNSRNLADDHLCVWPRCQATSAEDCPLCRRHMLRVYLRVQDEVSWFKEGLTSPEPKPDTRTGSVYFVRYRDRVKIGFSINPMDRIKAHPYDEVLAIVPGERVDEKRAHAAFAHLRENGEWFRAEEELLAFARDIGRKVA